MLLSQYAPVRRRCKDVSPLGFREVRLAIRVRKVVRRGPFTSQDELRRKVLAFINSFRRTLAGPFQWTVQNLALRCYPTRDC